MTFLYAENHPSHFSDNLYIRYEYFYFAYLVTSLQCSLSGQALSIRHATKLNVPKRRDETIQ